jgi:hypothetical protein
MSLEPTTQRVFTLYCVSSSYNEKQAPKRIQSDHFVNKKVDFDRQAAGNANNKGPRLLTALYHDSFTSSTEGCDT